MGRQKSVLQRLAVDEAERAHDCQHNQTHRLQRGDKRLKVTKDRTPEHFCVTCALKIIETDIAKLQALAVELRGSSLLEASALTPNH